ncbi:MAG: selenide, water dikinase SelD [Planctomycetes bacterium]|nr:selenide, water dikinase SelD [Planctomycetota bacterium]
MSGILSACTSGGCGAKICPGELGDLLASLPPGNHPDLLVGYDHRDDAAVYRFGDAAVVSTVDFFPPMVDDPFHFGAIAAANALSDIYAMGGEPLFALNLVCFPEKMDRAVLRDILHGGARTLAAAGIPLAGGHSIFDREIKYGLAVTGRVDPGRILHNGGCRPDDRLILTKPLGTGIILAAARVGMAEDGDYRQALAVMERLNAAAARTAAAFSPTACTDVTGFGLLVHLQEMAGREVGVEVWPEALPVLPGTRALAAEYLVTAAGQRNRRFMETRVDAASWAAVAMPDQEVLLDPQTSGGLLFSVPAAVAPAFLAAVRQAEPAAAVIGRVLPGPSRPIRFASVPPDEAGKG